MSKPRKRKYRDPETNKPLVTKLGLARISIFRADYAYVRAEDLHVESGRFSGEIDCRLVNGKWVCSITSIWQESQMTLRRQNLVIKAVERAFKNIPKERFQKAEATWINNSIYSAELRIDNGKKELAHYLDLESKL